LAHNVKLLRPVAKDSCVTWDDVAIDENVSAFRIRKEQDALYERGQLKLDGMQQRMSPAA
jgi:predicted homoserine dehydrogenase-like protein